MDRATPVDLRGRFPWATGQGSLCSSPSKSVRFMSHLWTGCRNLYKETKVSCYKQVNTTRVSGLTEYSSSKRQTDWWWWWWWWETVAHLFEGSCCCCCCCGPRCCCVVPPFCNPSMSWEAKNTFNYNNICALSYMLVWEVAYVLYCHIV